MYSLRALVKFPVFKKIFIYMFWIYMALRVKTIVLNQHITRSELLVSPYFY